MRWRREDVRLSRAGDEETVVMRYVRRMLVKGRRASGAACGLVTCSTTPEAGAEDDDTVL